MKTILVPLDFSSNSKNALNYAIMIANKLDMRLLLMHSYHTPVLEIVTDSYKILAHKEITGTPKDMQIELKAWKEAVSTTEANLQCDMIFTEGKPVSTIVRVAKQQAIDLIIMGTKGASGLKEMFIGSNTAQVIESVPCPVIAVPAGYEADEIKEIVFATDYHETDTNSIGFVVELANKFRSEIWVVHVAEENTKPRYEDNLLKYFEQQVRKSVQYERMKFHIVTGGYISDGLSEVISDKKADLFVISPEKLISESTASDTKFTWQFVNHINIPLLAFPISEPANTNPQN